VIVAKASDQPYLHAGLDGRERGVRAGAADTSGRGLGQQRAAGSGQVAHGTHHDVGLHAADDRHC
jgi:hypothetical protein